MKLGKAVIAGGAALGLVIGGGAMSASATTGNGITEYNEVGFYYSPGETGSLWDSVYWKSDNLRYQPSNTSPLVTFISAGGGQGQVVLNNAASLWNRNDYVVHVSYYSNQQGLTNVYPIQSVGELNQQYNLRNNEASYTCV